MNGGSRYDQASQREKNTHTYVENSTYEKAFVLLEEFKTSMKLKHIYEIREFVKYYVRFEKENADILNKILEELSDESESALGQLLSELINVEKEHCATRESLIKE